MRSAPVVIVGAGLAGLCCALRLAEAGRELLLIEAGDGVGGRVRTDEVDGFLLDRGFQVLLTAYPECRRALDYEALELRSFLPGALVRADGRFHELADPFRRPAAGLRSAFAPVGTLGDKLRVARLRLRLAGRPVAGLLAEPETTTLERLRSEGFSAGMIDRFFRPFYGGVFLERELATSSRMFAFLFRMFATGDTAVPADGMAEIPRQLAAGLPPRSIRRGTRVGEVAPGRGTGEGGETIAAEEVVVATSGAAARGLLGAAAGTERFHGVTCFYFAASEPPVEGPHLVLDGEGTGPVNNLHVVSEVSEKAAPPGAALISATVVGGAAGQEAETAVRRQLSGWFGAQVDRWRRLAVYRIPEALPAQPPGVLEPAERPVRLPNGLFVCGDHRENGSIHGAMRSGRRAAEALLEEPGALP
ncbi:MAG: NAD(P)/FAD-dependent oxidoreductase [Thermoanaerobaculia bacterium]|nr:NAD(P)/FAD-dependent oxidoreductase [Thermoanaerobaculia bacterium]